MLYGGRGCPLDRGLNSSTWYENASRIDALPTCVLVGRMLLWVKGFNQCFPGSLCTCSGRVGSQSNPPDGQNIHLEGSPF